LKHANPSCGQLSFSSLLYFLCTNLSKKAIRLVRNQDKYEGFGVNGRIIWIVGIYQAREVAAGRILVI
jgi:hypothetical protein